MCLALNSFKTGQWYLLPHCPGRKRRKWTCDFTRLEATRALKEHVLLLWRTGKFSTFDKPRTPPAVRNQSLDWSKDRPDRGNQIGQIPREWQSHASINL